MIYLIIHSIIIQSRTTLMKGMEKTKKRSDIICINTLLTGRECDCRGLGEKCSKNGKNGREKTRRNED